MLALQVEGELLCLNILAEINRVIELEGPTLDRVRESVGPAYEQAVRLLFRSQGKVILTGIGDYGKS